MTTVRLADLLQGIQVRGVVGDPGVDVTGIAYDSRRLQPGDLFLAWRGARFDAHDFVTGAFGAGAAAAVLEREGAVPVDLPAGRSAVLVADARAVAGPVSATFYRHPTARLGMVGVTGTNGKTTTTYLVRELLGMLGPVGLVGTVSAVVGGQAYPSRLTTPEAPDLQRLFSEMAAAGDRHCVMEVSSIALARRRAESVAFDVAVFTNLTPDHLGPHEHASFAQYRDSKRRLFELVGRPVPGAPAKSVPTGAAVNVDDKFGEHMAAAAAGTVPILRFGLRPEADVRAEDVCLSATGAAFRVVFPGGAVPCRVRLPGRFNVYNALGAFCVGLFYGLGAQDIAEALGRVPGVPGRLELVPGPQPFAVLVDYAHTPDGLENVLRAAREIVGASPAPGRVIAVFGCGGDRDRSKRPLMGEIGARLADVAWLTSDNPRSESPEAILREIEAGAARIVGADYRATPDRREAIGAAIALARPGDVVIIAGKGHENYQIFADRTIHFDDREEAAAALARLGYR